MKKLLIVFLFLTSLCYAQTPKINDNKLNEYKIDMNILLNKILFKRISFDKKTYPETVDELYKISRNSYKKLLQNKDDIKERQKLLYSYGTISAFPTDICDEFHNVVSKYGIDYYDDFVSQKKRLSILLCAKIFRAL